MLVPFGETVQGSVFVLETLKDGQWLGNRQKLIQLLRQVQQLEMTALIAHLGAGISEPRP